MIRINQLALEVGHGPRAIKKRQTRLLKVPETSIRRWMWCAAPSTPGKRTGSCTATSWM
ncbi:MAG: hypothetical protein ACLU8D_08200 [Enterocloster sp.]